MILTVTIQRWRERDFLAELTSHNVNASIWRQGETDSTIDTYPTDQYSRQTVLKIAERYR